MVNNNPEASGSSANQRGHLREYLLITGGVAVASTTILALGYLLSSNSDESAPSYPADPQSICGPKARELPEYGFSFSVKPLRRKVLQGGDEVSSDETEQEWDGLEVWVERSLVNQQPPPDTTYRIEVSLNYTEDEEAATRDAKLFAGRAMLELGYPLVSPPKTILTADNNAADVSIIACAEE